MKLRDWKDGLRKPLAIESANASAVDRISVFDEGLLRAQVVQLDLRAFAGRTSLAVDGTRETSETMRALGHPGNLMVNRDQDMSANCINLTFYAASGPGERVKQVFEARRVKGVMVELIITPFRTSAVYELLGESMSKFSYERLIEAITADMKYLRGWPPETQFTISKELTKGVIKIPPGMKVEALKGKRADLIIMEDELKSSDDVLDAFGEVLKAFSPSPEDD